MNPNDNQNNGFNPQNNQGGQTEFNNQNNYQNGQPNDQFSQVQNNFSNQPNWPNGMNQDPSQFYHQNQQQNQAYPNQPYQQPSQPSQPQNQQNYYQNPQNNSQFSQPLPPPRDNSQQKPVSRMRDPKRFDKKPVIIRFVDWLKSNWWAPAIGVLIFIIFGQIIYQMTIPQDKLLAGTKIDGINFSGWKKNDAINKLNDVYANIKTEIYFGGSTNPYKTDKASNVGIKAENTNRFKNLEYPIYLRIIPTSIWWANLNPKVPGPDFKYDEQKIDSYVAKKIGDRCEIKSQNATIKVDDGQFVVVGSQPGGNCNTKELKENIKGVKPKGSSLKNSKYIIRTKINETPAPIPDEVAQKTADELNQRFKNDLPMKINDKTEKINSNIAKTWFEFNVNQKEVDGIQTAPKLEFNIKNDSLDSYLSKSIKQKVEKKPGTTKISTKDFEEVSRKDAPGGVAIDIGATADTIKKFALKQNEESTLITRGISSKVEYNREYTPTEQGFKALVSQFSDDNGGDIGIYFFEDSGKKPLFKAFVNEHKKMSGKGIEGSYIAYVAEYMIENGELHDKAKVGDKNVEICIESAIKNQDKDCINGLIERVSAARATEILQQLGLQNTQFNNTGVVTTAADAGNFMYRLMKNQANIKKGSYLQSIMKNTLSRNGIIRGVASSGGSANSVTSMIGSKAEQGYNEASIVSYKGRFILGIISDKGDADLAQKLAKSIMDLKTKKNEAK